MAETDWARFLGWADPWLVPWFNLLDAPVTPLEILAFVLSLWMVWCNLRVRMAGWPLAIASSFLYGVFFAKGKLYGEAALQLVFIGVSLWGWRQWWLNRHQVQQSDLGVRSLAVGSRWRLAALALMLWTAMGYLLDRATDSDVPYFDALPTTLSLLGQYLLARKYLDNWPTWLAVNVISVALFAYRGYWLTVVLYALFALLSVQGWRQWQQLMKPVRP